ncbi:MAG TPA: hypothetical protein VGL65_04035 [Gemmatimonadales bacterium]
MRGRVKPDRDANARPTIRDFWWRYGWPRKELRGALDGLRQGVATVETAKYRFFVRFDTYIAPDHKLIAIAFENPYLLGVLSSVIHEQWATVAGGDVGGNTPAYNKTLCFDPFPFPDPTPDLRTTIGALAEHLDTHRKDAIARDERVTMTGMYNVVEKLRSGEALTPRERAIHEIAACGVLRDLHDELDALVAEAYGWPWPMEKEEILERLVTLHDERVEEEKRGLIRWLRPDYQIPRFAPQAVTERLELVERPVEAPSEAVKPWPTTAVDQLAAIGSLLAQRAMTTKEMVAAFDGAKRDLVERHLETLALMGEVTKDADGRYAASRKAA